MRTILTAEQIPKYEKLHAEREAKAKQQDRRSTKRRLARGHWLLLASFSSFLSFKSLDFAIIFWKRSTRPSVSTSFWRPVKKGWQLEQISTRMSPLWVERVLKVLPQAQTTLISS